MLAKNIEDKEQIIMSINTANLDDDLTTKSDESLVSLYVSDSNTDAFDELVNRYSDKIYRLGLRITNNMSDAEEILQEVFLILVEKLHTFRKESKFSTWLFRVASNAAYMHIRKDKRHQQNHFSIDDYKPYNDSGVLSGVEDKDWSETPDETLLSREGTDAIESAINELPKDYRIVFHMKDIEGLKSKEIAEALGLSLPAVKSRVLRARLFLRDKLSDYFQERGLSK